MHCDEGHSSLLPSAPYAERASAAGSRVVRANVADSSADSSAERKQMSVAADVNAACAVCAERGSNAACAACAERGSNAACVMSAACTASCP